MAFDFPNAPTVGRIFSGYVWDGEKWLSQPAKGSKKNYIINGAMMVSQENSTTAGSNAGFYPADQFMITMAGTSGVYTAAQVAVSTPGGSSARIRFIATTADAAVGAGDIVFIQQVLEGLRVADLRFGSAAAKTITLQFGVKAPAGTYCVALLNGATNRSYIAEYVIVAGEANTDVVKSITVSGDTTGTWPVDNTQGIIIRWGLMAGTTYQQAAGSWGTGNAVGSANQFNFMGTGGNTFELFDVSFTEGTIAPPFQVPDYASELAVCRRYFYNGVPSLRGYVSATNTVGFMGAGHPVKMRAVPTVTITSPVFMTETTMFTTLASIQTNRSTIDVLELDGFSAAAGMTVGRPAMVYQGASNGNISVNARL